MLKTLDKGSYIAIGCNGDDPLLIETDGGEFTYVVLPMHDGEKAPSPNHAWDEAKSSSVISTFVEEPVPPAGLFLNKGSFFSCSFPATVRLPFGDSISVSGVIAPLPARAIISRPAASFQFPFESWYFQSAMGGKKGVLYCLASKLASLCLPQKG